MHWMFLICSERSGSNLTRRMFDAHPDWCGPPPVHVIRALCDHAPLYRELEDDETWLALLRDVVALLDTAIGTWKTTWSVDRLAGCVPDRSVGSVVRCLYEHEARAHGKTNVFIKENHTWRLLEFLDEWFPGARFLHQVRDPRDMAASWKRQNVLRGDVVRAAHVWRSDQEGTREKMPLLTRQGRVASQTYEAVLRSPVATVRATCETLGIEFTPAMLSFHLSADTRRDASATSVWSNLSRPLMKNNVGTFERTLDEDEVRYVEAVCADSMCELGYQATLPLASGAELDALRGRLVPRERQEKSGYQRLPAAERDLRRRRVEVLRGLAARLAAVQGPQ